jgi:AcrR family transcriptional regulator
MARDRFTTRAAILQSAAELVAANGVAELGVNGLADAARCDKVLIYRYFGGLDGVLEALGAERMLWPAVQLADDSENDATLADAVETILLEEWAALSSGALMIQAAAAEIVSPNPLAPATAMQRSERHGAMIAALREKHRVPPYIDLPAIVEMLSAALTLFALRAAQARGEASGDTSAGSAGAAPHAQALDPNTPAGWRRIEKTLATVTRALLEADGR